MKVKIAHFLFQVYIYKNARGVFSYLRKWLLQQLWNPYAMKNLYHNYNTESSSVSF